MSGSPWNFEPPNKRTVEKSMGMSFFAACPWPIPGMQGLSSMDYTAALLQFPENAPAKSRQGRPLTGGLSVPRKSGHTRNADLTIMQHGGRCPDLSGSACALLIGHETKKDIPMLNHIVSFIYNPEAKRRGHLLSRISIL